MWTAIDGDNLPAGIDMVVLDNAMAMDLKMHSHVWRVTH